MAPISPLSFAFCATPLPARGRCGRSHAVCRFGRIRWVGSGPPSGAIGSRKEGGERTERRSAMRAANPAFIPRNHLVEEAIIAAVNDGNFSVFERLLSVVSAPYEDQPANERYADPPRPDQIVHETFCGT